MPMKIMSSALAGTGQMQAGSYGKSVTNYLESNARYATWLGSKAPALNDVATHYGETRIGAIRDKAALDKVLQRKNSPADFLRRALNRQDPDVDRGTKALLGWDRNYGWPLVGASAGTSVFPGILTLLGVAGFHLTMGEMFNDHVRQAPTSPLFRFRYQTAGAGFSTGAIAGYAAGFFEGARGFLNHTGQEWYQLTLMAQFDEHGQFTENLGHFFGQVVAQPFAWAAAGAIASACAFVAAELAFNAFREWDEHLTRSVLLAKFESALRLHGNADPSRFFSDVPEQFPSFMMGEMNGAVGELDALISSLNGNLKDKDAPLAHELLELTGQRRKILSGILRAFDRSDLPPLKKMSLAWDAITAAGPEMKRLSALEREFNQREIPNQGGFDGRVLREGRQTLFEIATRSNALLDGLLRTMSEITLSPLSASR